MNGVATIPSKWAHIVPPFPLCVYASNLHNTWRKARTEKIEKSPHHVKIAKVITKTISVTIKKKKSAF